MHLATFQEVLRLEGIALSHDDYYQKYLGFDDYDCFKAVGADHDMAFTDAKVHQLTDAKTQLVLKEFQTSVQTLPGAVELIHHLSGQIPMAICSGALREDIVPIIGKLGIADAFDTIVTAEDTPVSKPDPAPYRLTAKRLGITRGLVIEDTPAGIASGKSAGMKVLAVTNSYDRSFLTDADAIVDTLEDLTLEALRAVIG